MFEKFKIFKTLVEQETGMTIKTFRTDRGGEFISNEFQAFCRDHGIARHLTAPYTPQQNGVVERRNRTLLGMTRSILKHTKMPNYMWGGTYKTLDLYHKSCGDSNSHIKDTLWSFQTKETKHRTHTSVWLHRLYES